MNDIYLILLAVLVFTLIVLCIFVVVKVRNRTGKRIYKPKGPFLLSAGETRFFDALMQCLPANTYACPKVRIADIVEVNLPENDENYWKMLNKITRKHVDFLICKRSDFTPLLIIELDGGSHKDKSRSERDIFVDSVFKDAGIPTLHVPVTSFYDYKNLSALINSEIKSNL